PYMNTTAENMVYWIFRQVAQHLPKEREIRVEYVRLYETPTSFAEFRREWEIDD
ncbi:6-pyruvoyl trahydropterin synthase family protein, partial [Streptococcus gallolyticus]